MGHDRVDIRDICHLGGGEGKETLNEIPEDFGFPPGEGHGSTNSLLLHLQIIATMLMNILLISTLTTVYSFPGRRG